MSNENRTIGHDFGSLKKIQRIKVDATLHQGAKLSALKRAELISTLKTQKELFKTKLNLASLETSKSQNGIIGGENWREKAGDSLIPVLSLAQIKHIELMNKPKQLKEELFDDSQSRSMTY